MLPFDLAPRLDAIQPFHVMELVKRADRLAASGRSIIHMSIGEPDFPSPEPVAAALARAVAERRTGYTPAVGLDALREAIAGHYRTAYGLDVAPGRIVVTAGASAALLVRALVARCLRHMSKDLKDLKRSLIHSRVSINVSLFKQAVKFVFLLKMRRFRIMTPSCCAKIS